MAKSRKLKKPKRFFIALTDRVNRFPPWLLHLNKFYILRHHIEKTPQIRTSPDAIVRVADIDDANAIATCCQKPVINIVNRFESGDFCFVILIDDKIVGFEWMAGSTTFIENSQGITFHVRPEVMWVYDGFVVLEYRLRGLWVSLQYAITKYLKTNQKLLVACSVDYDNVSSLKAHLRFGYETTDMVYSVTLLGLAIRIHKNIVADKNKFQISCWRNYLKIRL